MNIWLYKKNVSTHILNTCDFIEEVTPVFNI